jgi:hypothetical protein
LSIAKNPTAKSAGVSIIFLTRLEKIKMEKESMFLFGIMKKIKSFWTSQATFAYN